MAGKARVLRAPGRGFEGRFAGAAAVTRKRWWQSPSTCAPRRQLKPRVAEPDPSVRVALLMDYERFVAEHAASRRRWFEKGRAIFPPGTCAMRGLPGVHIREGPSPLMRA